MQLTYLKTLGVVLERGTLSDAARDVNLTASAVGLQIKQLEAYFGRPLFDRSGRTLRATPLARAIVQASQETLIELEALRRPHGQEITGILRVGAIEHCQTTIIPEAMRHLRLGAPQLKVQFMRGTSDELIGAVKATRLDAAVVIKENERQSKQTHWVPLKLQPYYLVVPAEAPLKSAIELLREYEWIRLDRGATGGKIAASWIQSVLPGKHSCADVSSIESIVAMVALSLGVSVLPKLRPELMAAYRVREVPLGLQSLYRQIALVMRKADVEDRRLEVLQYALVAGVAAMRVKEAAP